MTSNAAVKKITSQIRRANRHLRQKDAEPSNAHLALWGALSIAHLNPEVALGQASAGDAELVLTDLLADLMHWCDLAPGDSSDENLFDSALKRAREYYWEEAQHPAPIGDPLERGGPGGAS